MKNNLNNELTITHNNDTLPITVDSVDLSKVITVNSLSELKDRVGGSKHKPPTIWISGYHTKGDNAFGSHIFEWDENCTESHNGGTIIDPNAPFPVDWIDSDQVDNWYNYSSTTNGRYKLRYNGAINVKWFMNSSDISDDIGIQRALNSFSKGEFYLGSSEYTFLNTVFLTTYQSIKADKAIINYNGNTTAFHIATTNSFENYQAYTNNSIKGVIFNSTVDKDTDPFATENTAITMGSGVFTKTHNETCFRYDIEECQFNGFKRGIMFANRCQGFISVSKCYFNNNFIGIEAYGTNDAGQQSISNCQFINSYTDFGSFNYDINGDLKSVKSCNIVFDKCCFSGWYNNNIAPSVKSSWNAGAGTHKYLPSLTTNNRIPDHIIDGKNDQVKYDNCSFESGTYNQKQFISFNRSNNGSAKVLTISDSKFGFGYSQTTNTTSDRPESSLYINGGKFTFRNNKVGSFGDMDNQFDYFIKLSHGSNVKYNKWDISIVPSPNALSTTGFILVGLESSLNSGVFKELPNYNNKYVDAVSLIRSNNFIERKPLKKVVPFSSTFTPDVQETTWYAMYVTGNLTINNPSVGGEGIELIIQLSCDGSNRTVTWGSNYRIDSSFPSDILANKTYYCKFIEKSNTGIYTMVSYSETDN